VLIRENSVLMSQSKRLSVLVFLFASAIGAFELFFDFYRA